MFLDELRRTNADHGWEERLRRQRSLRYFARPSTASWRVADWVLNGRNDTLGYEAKHLRGELVAMRFLLRRLLRIPGGSKDDGAVDHLDVEGVAGFDGEVIAQLGVQCNPSIVVDLQGGHSDNASY